MAGDTEMRNWADLLHNSTQLLQSATPSAQFPPIQRRLDQLEALSTKLKARTSRHEAPSQAIAATRLLAREGINADQLTQDLRSFELRTSFEDVFPVEATSVEEYLQQVHEMTMLSVMQEAQRDNLSAFNDYMMKAREDDWQKEKRDFLHNLSRLPPTPVPSVGPSPVGMKQSLWSQTVPAGSKSLQEMRSHGLDHKTVLERKAAAYAGVILQLNAARENGKPFKVAAAFKKACETISEVAQSAKSVSMIKIWQLVQCLLSEDFERSGSMTRKMDLIVGARRHLEGGHERYVLDTIQSHPAQAALGGSTGNLQLIRAFLRVRLRDHGVLDFDAQDFRRQPPYNTTWHQIFFCLRTGYYEEASIVAKSAAVSRAFSAQLAEWISMGGMVSVATSTAAAEECERIMRSGERSGRPGYDKNKLLLYAIISGSRQLMDKLLREIPTLFNTIEDFLWFNLAVARDNKCSFETVTNEGMQLYTVEDLQCYLLKFEPAYYTRNGKDPLVYPYVLLLSLQLHAAISHLINDSGNEGYNIDAVHIAVTFADHGVLEGVGSANKLSTLDSVTEVASVIRHYGLSHKRQGNLVLALEYYVQAAAAMGGGAASWNGNTSIDLVRQRQMMLKQLLTEILLSDGGVHLLLGPSGTGSEGALKRFLPDHQAQHRFLLEVAHHCQDSGLYDKAVELLKRVAAFALALEIVNSRLSEAINSMARGKIDGETKAAGLILAGNSILESHKVLGAASVQDMELIAEKQTALRQLETMLSFHKFARNGRYADALMELSRLSFLSTEELSAVPTIVHSCIPDLLKTALTCLENVPDVDGSLRVMKSKIASFVANSLPKNWPHELYARVARML